MSSKKWNLGLLLAFLWLLLGSTTAFAQERDRTDNELVVLTGRANVAEGETVGDLVIFNGPASVDGTVEGDVVAFNGRVTVTGTIDGDVLAFNGRVSIQDGARVSGDVQARDAARISDGATVGGDVKGLDFRFTDDVIAAARFAVWVAVSISALVLVMAFVWLFPRGADAVVRAGLARPGACVGWGVALFFAIPIVGVLLLVTVVGIPLGVGLLLAIVPLYALGYTVAAYFLGRRLLGVPRPRALSALVGVAILRAIALVPFLGGLAWFVGTVFGLGLLFVSAQGVIGPQATQERATTPA